jgi:hypothetical protein
MVAGVLKMDIVGKTSDRKWREGLVEVRAQGDGHDIPF